MFAVIILFSCHLSAQFAFEKLGCADTYVRSICYIPDIRDDIYGHQEQLIRLLKDTGVNVRILSPSNHFSTDLLVVIFSFANFVRGDTAINL